MSAKVKNQAADGFTIIELLIASGVFATLLVLSLAGFLQIGRLFYKGVSATQTQQVARQMMDSIQTDINFSPPTSTVTISNDYTSSGGTTYPVKYFCSNGNRYTFILGKVVNTDAEASMLASTAPQSQWHDFGVLKDRLTTGRSNVCAPPFRPAAQGGTPIDKTKVVELLGNNMRVSDLTITPVGQQLYTITVKIAFGSDSILQNSNLPSANCDRALSSSQYCFVSKLTTTISGNGY